MHVRLLSFGPWRGLLPQGGEVRGLAEGQTVGDLLEELRCEGRFDPAALRTAAVAVNQEYAAPTRLLAEGDEVAILPPVSGGGKGPEGAAFSPHPMQTILLTHDVIATGIILRNIKAGEDGAVCVFDGIVRNNTRGRKTLYLDYEAYESMALQQLHRLRTEAIQRFGVREVAIVHRLGKLLVGETSVLIAVSSAHRGAAFEACRWLIDTLKTTVPIWKREQFEDGAVWTDGEPFPDTLAGSPR